ncbi:LacI family DNA-binding transcriptional regulator [uncultured Roseovarius sp.]|uniref:LacI family DNA-binding transcriptional regulator n=1 Tax=uncultured Roseovarius sp. TaxID=293344 RepID=UPI0025D78965|nr:LacI family DNA-binding transcriptional regulator [uncultured Roseovarius sp.]
MQKDKKADIIAVAKAAKVSPSTVSRAFNHPDLVKATTRKKIDAAVRRLGYIRNRAAQTIHGIRSGTIGLIVPTIDHTIFAELIQSFSDAVAEQGFTILLASHDYSLEQEYALTRKMLEHRVDGMALVGVEHSKDTYGLLGQQNTPSILLWNVDETAPIPCVGSDNYLAGRLIAEHVTTLGHQDIAALFPPLAGNDRAARRFDGMQDTLCKAGCEVPRHRILETTYSIADAKEAVGRLITQGPTPSAILCGNDVLAWGALHALARAGLRVPQDVTVTGIGDFKGSRDFEPPLTTVRIPAPQIGTCAAEMIVASIIGTDPTPQNAIIAPELKVRATCRAI